MLAHWNNIPRIDMSSHSDTLSWFRVNQSHEHMIYRIRGEHANYYTTDAVKKKENII